MRHTLFGVALLVLSAQRLSAGGFASLGAGMGTEGTAAQIGLSATYRSWLLTARAAGSYGGGFEWMACPCPRSSEKSLLLGRTWKTGASFRSVSLGIGSAYRERRGRRLENALGCFFLCPEYETVETRGLALAFEGKLARAGRLGAFGLSAFGNLHPRTAYAGLGLTLDVGSLR